jgi:hypothetical protein
VFRFVAQIMSSFHDAARAELDEVAAKLALMEERFRQQPI